MMASWRQGELRPVLLRNVIYHDTRRTAFIMGAHMLVVAQMAKQPVASPDGAPMHDVELLVRESLSDGEPRLCQLTHTEPDLDILDPRIWAGAMRDHMCLKYVPAMVTTCCSQGRILSQNAASLACIGVHGADQLLTQLPSGSVPAYSQGPDLNYLLELFGSQESLDAALQTVARDGTFRQRIRVLSPTLLSWMQLPANARVYHGVSISKLKDGVTGQLTYIVAEVDVTDVVKAERRVQRLQTQQRALLKKILPQQVIDVLLEENKPNTEPAGPSSWGSEIPDDSSRSSTPMHHQQPRAMDSKHTSSTFSRSMEPLEGQASEAVARDAPSPSPLSHATYAQSDGAISPTAALAEGRETPELAGAGPSDGLDGAGGSLIGRDYTRNFSSTSGSLQLSPADVQKLSHFHNEVTILFTDIQGFTSMSQSLHPSQVMLFLNELFSAFDALLEEYDVYKVETIGDCYMVCAGLFDRTSSRRASTVNNDVELLLQPANSLALPSLNRQIADLESLVQRPKDVLGGCDPNHATKMMSFAKAMVCTAGSIETPLGAPVRMRVGVHSGPIMTGVVGRKMPRFCCFGDTVNTASRMESTGTAGAIHASAAFQALTPDERWLPTGGVEVKGKGHMDTFIMHYDPLWEQELP